MAGTPPPLWPGYDEASEDELLALLDRTENAANDRNDPTVNTAVASALATAIARHEGLKQEHDAGNYRRNVHQRASEVAGGWKP
jgi:hypothetical protein